MSAVLQTSPHTSSSMRPFSVTFLVFAVLLFAGNLYAEISNALVFYRTIFTLWTSLMFLIPSAFLYLSNRAESPWSRWCWTFALVSYLLHFYFAVGEVHGFSISSVFAKQGVFTATYNFIITVLWIVFTVTLWKNPGRFMIFKHSVVLLLLAGMLVASIVLKSGVVVWLGCALLVAIISGVIVRIKHNPQPQTS